MMESYFKALQEKYDISAGVIAVDAGVLSRIAKIMGAELTRSPHIISLKF